MTSATVDPAADHVFLAAGRAIRIAGPGSHVRSADCRCHPDRREVIFEDPADLPEPGQPLTRGYRRLVWVHAATTVD